MSIRWWLLPVLLTGLSFGIARAAGQPAAPPAPPPGAPPMPSDAQIAEMVRQMRAQIASAEGKVTAKSAYEPAGQSLALLCQSDPFFFLDEPPFAPAWTPPAVLKLSPTWVQISASGAHIEFGGGFHHFGYELTLDPSASTDTQNSWTLNFYSEDSPMRALETFTLPKASHVDRKDFVGGALAEFDRRASQPTVDEKTVIERITFLLKFDQVAMAQQSIRDCAAANTNDWLDQILAYLMDTEHAAGRLDAWAKKRGDFSAYLLEAYAFDAGGDEDSAERATTLALTRPVDEPDWLQTNIRHRGVTNCAELLKAQRYETCAKLCDALLAYSGDRDFLAEPIASIRDLARHAIEAPHDPPPAVPPLDNAFAPLAGIDVAHLRAKAAPTTASTLPVSKEDQLLRYYDHRIAAEPGSRKNYATKIQYLFSLHRNADALEACRNAGRIFPEWWLPPMTLAMCADAQSRPQAEAQLRQWSAAYPGFIHWWYLARYYRSQQRNADAVAALNNAVKYPLQNIDDDETWVPAAFAYDAASYAYQQKQFHLVLEIARVWASPRGVYNYMDDDIYAFRAAAELALRQFTAANDDADKVVKAAATHAIWAGNLDELRQAARAHNSEFVYDPGSVAGGDWSLYVLDPNR